MILSMCTETLDDRGRIESVLRYFTSKGKIKELQKLIWNGNDFTFEGYDSDKVKFTFFSDGDIINVTYEGITFDSKHEFTFDELGNMIDKIMDEFN